MTSPTQGVRRGAGAAQALALLQRHGIYAALILLLLAAAIIAPAFYSGGNLLILARTAAVLGVVTIGQTLVVLGGGIDLSVGGVMAMTTIVAADVTRGKDEKVLLAVLIALGLSAVVGLLNGLLVTWRQIPPFVGTLGMLVFLDGARLAYTKGVPSGEIPGLLRRLGTGSLLGIPIGVLIAVALGLFVWLVLRRGAFGRALYATGSNAEATRLSGVPVRSVLVATYVACSLLAGLAGIQLSGYIGYVDRYIGRGFDLDSIAAVAVGGVSLAGGAGSVAGSLAGVLLVTILVNLVVLLNLNIQLQLVVKGVVIVAAVALYSVRGRRQGG